MAAKELTQSIGPIIEQTGNFTERQRQVVMDINLVLNGQTRPEFDSDPVVAERIKEFCQSEYRTVEGAEWLAPEDLREKILVVALPEQPAALADTGVFLAGAFTKWDVEAWSFTHLDKNVFVLKAKGVKGQQCKFFARHEKIPVGALAHLLTKSGIEKPGVDGNKNNVWFLSGGKPSTDSHQNDIW